MSIPVQVHPEQYLNMMFAREQKRETNKERETHRDRDRNTERENKKVTKPVQTNLKLSQTTKSNIILTWFLILQS